MKKSELPKCPLCGSSPVVERAYPSVGYYTAETRLGYEVHCAIYCLRVEVKDGKIKNSVRDRERAYRAWCAVVETMKEENDEKI